MFEHADEALVLYLARCTLAKKAGRNNWVEEEAVDGLPEYICRIARAIHRDGSHSVSQSIAIAVSRAKAWATGAGGVTAKTRAKAAKAVAEWEAKKKAAKLDNKVKASNRDVVLNLSSYNVESIRRQYPTASPGSSAYRWVREIWNDHLIVELEQEGTPTKLFKVAYTVDEFGNATFGDEVEVRVVYSEMSEKSLQTNLTDAQLELGTLIPCTVKDNMTLLASVAQGEAMRQEYEELLRFSADKPNLSKLLNLAHYPKGSNR